MGHRVTIALSVAGLLALVPAAQARPLVASPPVEASATNPLAACPPDGSAAAAGRVWLADDQSRSVAR